MNMIPIYILMILVLAGCAGMQSPERQPGQVLVCHGDKTITVSNPDYLRHIEHGDKAGPCAN